MSSKAASLSVPAEHRLPGSVAEVALLAGPAVLHTLSDSLMQVVDAAIVGHLGMVELGAVGFAGVWMWTCTCAFVGAASGVQTFVAQELGAGHVRSSGRWAWQGLYALVPVSVLWFAVVGLLAGPFIGLLGPSPELHARAVEYVHARLIGQPAVAIGAVMAFYFRGLGDTRTPLIAAVVDNVVNVVLAYGLVFGRFGLPALGVAGAGLAMAISIWVGVAILAVAFHRRRRAIERRVDLPRPDPQAIRRFLRTAAPIGGQWLLDMLSFALFTTIIARMGDRAMAATQAMIQLLSLSFMQAMGIAIAAAALVGRFVGARDLAAAERAHRSALKLGLGVAVVVATLLLGAPELLLHVFTDDPGVIALGRPLLVLGALFQVADAGGIIVGGSLRGAGDTRWPFALQASLAWLVRLPAVYVAAVVLRGGVLGAWTAELGYVIVLGAVLLVRFERGAWRSIRI